MYVMTKSAYTLPAKVSLESTVASVLRNKDTFKDEQKRSTRVDYRRTM